MKRGWYRISQDKRCSNMRCEAAVTRGELMFRVVGIVDHGNSKKELTRTVWYCPPCAAELLYERCPEQ